MIFKHVRTYGNSNNFDTNKMKNQRPASMSMNMYVTPRSITTEQKIQRIETPAPKTKTMLWGEPTWYFLHCFAEKVNEDSFSQLRGPMINLIIQLCSNLPCPDCSRDASAYLKKINFQTITTKMGLKRLLWEFHNYVNEKKGYSLFPLTGLSQYEKANFIKVINDFLYHYKKRHYSIRLITDNLHRKDTAKNIEIWLKGNMVHFQL